MERARKEGTYLNLRGLFPNGTYREIEVLGSIFAAGRQLSYTEVDVLHYMRLDTEANLIWEIRHQPRNLCCEDPVWMNFSGDEDEFRRDLVLLRTFL